MQEADDSRLLLGPPAEPSAGLPAEPSAEPLAAGAAGTGSTTFSTPRCRNVWLSVGVVLLLGVVAMAIATAIGVGPVTLFLPVSGRGGPRKQDFSYVGQAAIDALENYSDMEGKAWSLVDDLSNFTKIFTPPRSHWSWNQLSPEMKFGKPCASGPHCNLEFGLYMCTTDEDCSGYGTCQALNCTVTTPRGAPQQLCVGPAVSIVDHYYRVITRAQEFVDITSLDSPDLIGATGERGIWSAAIRNAVEFLSNSNRSVKIKMVFGTEFTTTESPSLIIDSLTRNLPATSTVQLYVGSYRSSVSSWNHGKIVAVDDSALLWGGINFYTGDYLLKDPVFDLSAQGTGGKVAIAGHRYADYLWDRGVINGHNDVAQATAFSTWSKGHKTDYDPHARSWPPPDVYNPSQQPAPATPGLRAIVTARFGALGPNPSNHAFAAALKSARQMVRIAQQDLGPYLPLGHGWKLFDAGWPNNYLVALNDAMGRGAQVRIILSNPCAFGNGTGDDGSCKTLDDPNTDISNADASHNGGPYGYGWTLKAVLTQFSQMANWKPEFKEQLQLAYIGVDGHDAWPDGANIGTHYKFWAVDDQAFYIGSQNMYVCNLAEFGVIVDNKEQTEMMISSYYEPLWRQRVQ
jgi:phosphatidylserine/phosphatidylglycerophosphate/cardiolipin synthase-like enzyme